ncbi:hypothetical protein JB92DRAFT_3093207 [Gautieria morchelliformis]|nr:hypothetical protein JB92DRAFT_3093207 [Gautieria morchelliformis]
MLHTKLRPVDFDALPPLHTIHTAAGNKLQMDVVKMPAAIMQLAFNSIYIVLSMLTMATLDCICSNNNLCSKKIPFGNGVGKQSLDDSFPPEDALHTATFLQAYQNWSFTAHLPAWRILDRMLRTQFTDKPFLVDPNDPTHFAMLKYLGDDELGPGAEQSVPDTFFPALLPGKR